MHRPVIAFAPDINGYIKGSARSIPGLHIRDALDLVATKSPGLLTRFGGHAMAAGLSLKEEQLDDFRVAFNSAVSEMISEEMLTSVVWTDGELSASEMTLSTAMLLQQSGPWGQAFPEPVFEGQFTVLSRRIVGEKHLKLQIRSEPEGKMVEAIHFFFEEELWPDTTSNFKLAYKLAINSYRGEESVQLIVEHAIPLD
jgi:single-stranded-DNA-specific exonuclease